jgi:acetyl-CoA carboxylase/biotin carboxylase 1
MEMYAAETARAGVLEVEGIVAIKFRRDALVVAMHRNDPALVALDAELADATAAAVVAAAALADVKKISTKTGDKAVSAAAPVATAYMGRSVATIKEDMKNREQLLIPYYHTVATSFADLHDTPGRMKAKDVITAVVPWATSRTYFYWRMRRRLIESKLICEILDENKALDGDFKQAQKQLSGVIDKAAFVDDKTFTLWMEKNGDHVTTALAGLAEKAAVAEISGKVKGLSAAAKAELLKLLTPSK